jgi:hypothetical protein
VTRFASGEGRVTRPHRAIDPGLAGG